MWKNKGGGVKIPLSEAELSFGTPKGVITARKRSHSTKRIVFSTFFGFSDFINFEFLGFSDFPTFRISIFQILEIGFFFF